MIVDLDSLIEEASTQDLPSISQISEGYQHPMIKAKGNDNPKLFSWGFLKYTDYLMEAAKYFEDQVVVDLGVGRHLDGYALAHVVGVKGYIAVEPFNVTKYYQRLTNSSEVKENKEINKIISDVKNFIPTRNYEPELVRRMASRMETYLQKGLGNVPIAIVAEDLVSALKRLPDDSVNVMVAGLDKCILWRDEYAAESEEQIERVLSVDGAFLAIGSRLEPSGLIYDEQASDNEFKEFIKRKK